METSIAIGVGLLVSLLFTEVFGLSVGGMIVPGYLAMHLGSPLTIVATVLASMITLSAVRLISQQSIVFGRRRVVLTMLLGFLAGEGLRLLLQTGSAWASHVTEGIQAGQSSEFDTGMINSVTVVGFVIPGLIALWMDRTSVLQTLSPLVAATGIVHLTLVVIGVSL